MSNTKFEVLVIGSGPGGYVAAIRAGQLGMKTGIVEREHLGGICLNWGCIPTKALLRCSEIHHLLQHLGDYGFSASDIRFDTEKIVKRSRQVAAQLASGVKHLLKKNKVTVLEGHGRLAAGGNQVEVTQKESVSMYQAQHIILATGARARTLPNLQPDEQDIVTYKEAMIPKTIPKSLIVIGSGAIGIEFASFYHHLGSKVTVIEILERILPQEDEEISAFAQKTFEKQGMRILTGTTVTSWKKNHQGKVIVSTNSQKGEEDIEAERVILAIGIVGNVEDIGLEGSKVVVDQSHIVVNPWMETGESGVYAIGDVVGAPWLAHKASHEGILCVERIAGKQVEPLDVLRIPGCTYSLPQVASIGLTEKAAKDKGYEVRVGRFPFLGNGKAIALGEPEGMVKTIFDTQSGELLGAHMIGTEVTEMIQGYSIAKTLETTEAELMHTIFPHPTLSEMMHESVLHAYGRAIHI